MRFGLFGTGWWASQTQGPGLLRAEDAELVGVWGRDPDKAAALAGTLGARPYSDVDALLADVDAAAIALPPDIQAPLAVRAARAGRHLLLDKPVALSLADADAVLDAVEAAGVAGAVFLTGRYMPGTEAVVQDAAGQTGWDGARVAILVSGLADGGELHASPWRVRYGALWDVAPHALAPVLPVLGPVAEVTAVAGPRRTTHLLLRHDGGAVTAVAVTLAAPEPSNRWEIEFYGEPGWRSLPWWDVPNEEAFALAVTDLVRAAGGGPAPRCDVRFGRDIVAILAAAETALAEHRPVRPAR